MAATATLSKASLQAEILRLKREKNAVILAHYYQEPDIQDLADFVGDSLGLSQQAAATNADIIVFAGVHFMAETAKILNPTKKVILPDPAASCSLAESCEPADFKAFVEAHPGHVVISYINCSAGIKALSDIICTSANAEKIVRSVPADTPIIFAPDKNLGAYISQKTGREMVLWDGACIVHEAFALEKIVALRNKHPHAKFIAHPESEAAILQVAHYVGSTTGMIRFAIEDDADSYIVATEAGLLHQMQKEVPHKTLIPAPAKEDNTCACSECHFMKMNTLEKLHRCLEREQPEIILPEALRLRALLPLERMLALSK
jgi:quinolinate synthase